MELSTKKKLHALSLAEKIQVLELLDESKMSQSEVARRFQVSQPQISRICKNKEKLLADWCSGTANHERKRKRESKYSGIDEALLCWYHIARAKAWDVTGPMLLHKAKELADIMGQDFVPSIGWLVRWKRRNNVGFGARQVLVPLFAPEPPPPGLPSQAQPPLSLKDFSPEDVFGCAEVPLLYRAVPGRVFACDRLQVLLCANSRDLEDENPGPKVCKEETGTEDREEDGFQTLPTKADALRALCTLRRWLECNSTSPELFEKFYDCEVEVEQLCCL